MSHSLQGPKTGGIVDDKATEYIRSLIKPSSKLQERLESLAVTRNVPIIAPEVASLLRMLVNITKPKTILEIGTAMGYSALVMAEENESLEKLYTLERRYDRYKEAEVVFEDAGLSDKVIQFCGEATEILEGWENPVDFVFMDGAKSHYEEFFILIEPWLNKGGLVVCDNVLFRGMVAESSEVNRRDRTLVNRMRNFLSEISEDSRFEIVLASIHDGVAVIRKG